MKECRKVKITKVNDEVLEMKCSGFTINEKYFIIHDVKNMFGNYEDFKINQSIIKLFVYFI